MTNPIMSGLRHSTIETFRKRFHGNCVLKLYSLDADGDSLNVITPNLTKGFYLSPNTDSGEGATPYVLTIDKIYTEALTVSKIMNIFMVDMVNTVTNETRRYRIDTDTRPPVNEWRYALGCHAAFSDGRTVNA